MLRQTRSSFSNKRTFDSAFIKSTATEVVFLNNAITDQLFSLLPNNRA